MKATTFAIQTILVASNKLALASWGRGSSSWQLKPKRHQLLELMWHVEATRLNPGAYWCFGDEDHVGNVSSLAHRCHRRTAVKSSVRRYLLQYRSGAESQRQ